MALMFPSLLSIGIGEGNAGLIDMHAGQRGRVGVFLRVCVHLAAELGRYIFCRASCIHPPSHPTGRMQVNQQQPHAPSASAIHWAATKGDLRALRWLVEYEGVDPSAKDTSSHHCETPLFRAAGANHPEVCTYICVCTSR